MGPEEIPLVHCRCSRRPGRCVCSQPHMLCSERTFKLGWAPPPPNPTLSGDAGHPPTALAEKEASEHPPVQV